MSQIVTWRALQPCHVAGAYREAGEEFEAPDGDFDPAVRGKVSEPVGADLARSKAKTVTAPKAKSHPVQTPGVTPEELFGGLPDA